MILGTFIITIFKIVISILTLFLFAPLFLIKISFFWFAMIFAASYIFFLIVHQSQVELVRKDIALALAKSLGLGFIVACCIEAFLQYWSFDVATSAWFLGHQSSLMSMCSALTTQGMVENRIVLMMIFLSGFFSAHLVGDMLDSWYSDNISELYGWMVVAITLLCCAFLWFVVFSV